MKVARRNPDWVGRAALASLAVLGTLAYAASFRLGGTTPGWPASAAAVGLAAGLAWPVFGLVLLALGGPRVSAAAWVDSCLRTMAAGMAVLSLSTAANVAAWLVGPLEPPTPGVHVAVLMASNVVMGVVFVGRAAALGLRTTTAVIAWVVGLDGVFALFLLLFYRLGVFLV